MIYDIPKHRTENGIDYDIARIKERHHGAKGGKVLVSYRKHISSTYDFANVHAQN